MIRLHALSIVAIVAATSCGGSSSHLPEEIGRFGCGIALIPARVDDTEVRGTVQDMTYRCDGDDVAGELATVAILAEDDSARSLRFWTQGRLPIAVGDRLQARVRCRADRPPLSRCDGTFSVDGQLALVIAGSSDARLPDGWSLRPADGSGATRRTARRFAPNTCCWSVTARLRSRSGASQPVGGHDWPARAG